MAVAAAVVMAPSSAQAITLTADDSSQYEVNTAQGTFNSSLITQLINNPWWGSSTLSEDLADNLGTQLGLPNIPNANPANNEGPYFAFNLSDAGIISAWNWDGDLNMVELDTTNNTLGTEYVWAVGEAAAIPTPALLPAMLGMGASIVRKRKKQSDAAA